MEENKFKIQKPIDVKGIRLFARNTILDLGVGYISYASDLCETAVVLNGEGVFGVMYLVLDGDKRKEVEKVIQDKRQKEGLLFGAVVAWACSHKDLNIERSTIGDFCSRCGFKEIKPVLQPNNNNN